MPWLVAAAMLAPRPAGSINRVLQEVEATEVVMTPRRLAVEMLGPLIMPGSRFLELFVVVVEAWSFISL
jgi:hypothetical protein